MAAVSPVLPSGLPPGRNEAGHVRGKTYLIQQYIKNNTHNIHVNNIKRQKQLLSAFSTTVELTVTIFMNITTMFL